MINPMHVIYLKDPATFLLDSGLLFEINRRVLHPFGLALAVQPGVTDATGECTMARLWDYRADPEGIDYAPETFDDGLRKYNITVETFKNAGKFETRRAALGYVIQGCSLEQMAIRAYVAYGDSTGGVNFLGKPMPHWVELPEKIQQAWRDAVKAVVEP